ncbi:MAG: FAD-dependent oxidoreductase [Elainellaceae cyanobacterium]
MAVDYNLVILGGSLVAHNAALRAVAWGARVALVEPPRSSVDWEREQLQLAYLQASWNATDSPAQSPMHRSSRDATLQERLAQANAFANWQLEQSSPAYLGAKGIDVVLGKGAFVNRPALGVLVGHRLLRGHHYLIAGAAEPHAPESLQSVSIASLQQLLPAQSVGVWGDHPQGIVLAQALRRLGLPVVLATPAPRLLPDEAPAAVALLQAQLEAEGVRVVTSATLKTEPLASSWNTGLRKAGASEATALGEEGLATGDRASERPKATDRVIIQSGSLVLGVDSVISPGVYRPALSTLNLPSTISTTPRGIEVNSRLQTAHPCIYACGYTINAACSENKAIAEAQVAVDNALSLPYRRIAYSKIPRVLMADPPLIQIGLTLQQAQQVSKGAVASQTALPPKRQAQLDGKPLGLYQTVLSRRGRILGGCAVGPDAQSWAEALGWAIAQRTKIQSLADWPNTACGEAMSTLAEQWRRRRRGWRVDGRELLLSWRRDWTR